MPIVVGSTAVSVPGMMPFYAAGQIVGILNGLAGGAEYEYLLEEKYEYIVTLGPSLDAQSVAHVLILVFIVIGNIGWLLTRSKGGKS